MPADPIARLNAALESRYRIERQLGEGGMATVYLADDLRHERKVALKILKPELAAVLGAQRFLAEIKTTANLQHPHILPLFDSGEADGFLFFVMPYVEGENLQDRLDREHQLPVGEAVAIATHVAEALDYAHSRGIVHRDIKPANILLAAGKPLVADFGIALAARTAGGSRLTETGLSLGTPYYMSPEQASGDQAVGPSTDVYALGCVLYEMLAGEPPHTGSTAQAVLAKILTGRAPPVSERRRTVPPHVAGAVEKALERLPADRFGSAAELHRALADPAFRYGEGLAAGRSGWASTSTRGRTVALASVGVAVASVAVALASLSGSASDAEPVRPTRVTLVESRPGGPRPLVSPVAISRDGREVAFLGVEEGRVSLYLRSLGSPEVRPISGSAPLGGTDQLPIAFSPDGRSVAFGSPDGLVRRVSIEGGALAPVAQTGTVPIGLSWSERFGVVMGMFSFNSEQPGLTRAAMDDTTVRRVAEPEPGSMWHAPYVLPGGAIALFSYRAAGAPVQSTTGRRAGGFLGVVALEDGAFETYPLDPEINSVEAVVGVANGVLVYWDLTRTLMAVRWDDERHAPVGRSVPVPDVPDGAAYAAMAEDGTLVLAVGSTQMELAVVNDRGDPLLELTEDPFYWAVPRFSPDGARLAVAGGLARRGAGLGDLWTFELATGPMTLLSVGLPLRHATWTPDGRRVLVPIGFDRERRGRDGQVWSRAADASDQPSVFLDDPGAQIWAVEPSPDGRALVLVVSTSDDPTTPAYDVVVRSLVGDTTRVPFAAGTANEVAPRFSPDGRWLAYASNESGRYEVYVRPFPGPGGRIQVSDAGGGQPVWAADGRRLFYRGESGFMAAGVQADPASGLLRVASRERLFDSSTMAGSGTYVATFDVHPDGERFAIARGTGAGSEIVLWLDWMDDVKTLLAMR